MVYRVIGNAHGSFFSEVFDTQDEACDYASQVIDGDVDSDVEVIAWFK